MAESLSKSDHAGLALLGVDPSYFELCHGTFGRPVLPNHKPGVDPCEVWCSQPVEKLMEYCNVLKIMLMWPRFSTRKTGSFVDEYGFLFLDWDMNTIQKWNLLEEVADLIKKVVNVPHFISGILRIGNGIENGVFHLPEALEWVRLVGNEGILQELKELGDSVRLWLVVLFVVWRRCITRVALEGWDLLQELQNLSCDSSRRESEALKLQGNAEFARGDLCSAILSYTEAIDFCPTNHLLYGNRALCFLLSRQYERAFIDAKKATILKPDWPKGHHHFCKALSLLGKTELALEANEKALKLCQKNPEGLRELLQQNEKLKKTLQEIPGAKHEQEARKGQLEKKDSVSSKSHSRSSQEQKGAGKERKRAQAEPKKSQEQEAKVPKPHRTEGKVSTLEQPPNQSQQNKRRPKPKSCDHEKMRDHMDLKRESKAMEDKNFCAVPQGDLSPDVKALGLEGGAASMDTEKLTLLPLLKALNSLEFKVDYFSTLPEELQGLAREGSRALLEQQSHGAERAFSQLLSILQNPGISYVNIININYVILLYGHATALLGMGQPEALAKAEDQFKKIIEEYPEENCFCLAYYGIGRVYLRQNRFAQALEQFLRAQLMIDFKSVPGVLTWPGTAQVIEETRIENLQVALRNYIEECKFPPEPDAVCRYQQCHGHSKTQIYFTDPDFKGFIRIICCQQCRVEFHINCWKKLKTTSCSDKNDKDFLKEMCFTPDCKGLISKIVIYSSSRLVKCEFEQKIPKPKEPPRACIKQKCSSLRKIKMKEEKKQRRKGAREEARNSARKKPEEKQEENAQSQHSQHRGLTATKNFLHRYGQALQELDFSILTPLWNQKYGNKFDYLPNDGEKQKIWDYFLTPPLEKSRCFIWLLEENREHFPGLQQALDEFFDKMDDPTIILKKQGNENLSNNEIKVKNKTRKKNLKDSKSILVLSSGVSTAPRDEEKIFIEENNLYRDFPDEPFVIPEYLQEQLEEFEALYNVSNSNHYHINNNNNNYQHHPDPIYENLYDYFSQILEEHGPLEINNKLLVGEYENFPEETRKVVEDEGGLEPFLLKSLRFIMVDNLLALRKHMVLFEGNPSRNETGNEEEICREFPGNSSQSKVQLNPYAEEFRPLSYPVDPPLAAPPDLADYETPQYLPCSFPAPCIPGNPLENEDVDSMESKFSGVLPKGFEAAGPVFLPLSSWGYQYGILPLPQPGFICAHPAAPQENQESAIPWKSNPEASVPAGMEEGKGLRGHLENVDSAFPKGSHEDEGGKKAKKEKRKENKDGMKSNPHTRMVAVQVNQEVAHRETNTLPFHPFENQQGDALRGEKELQVLQEQLQEAEQKLQQLQSRRLEELGAVEELLKKSTEETEVSQNELHWFHQDSEAQMKKWQQEKKENQEKLKALKASVKKHSDTNDRYLKSIDDKEKQYNVCLNAFLDTSNTFANEKGKLEELIKKSQGDSQECEKRAVKAELSVLQTWKETEMWKLKGTIAKAEGNLRVLKALSSSASAAPVLKAQIDSWEIFISNVKKQLEKVEAEYDGKMELVKNGARNCLSKVEIVEFPFPQGVVTPGRTPMCDPAIVTYSSAPAPPSALPAFSRPDGKAPAPAPVQAQSGAEAAPATSKAPSAAGKTHPKAPQGSNPKNPSASHPSGTSGSGTQQQQAQQDPSALQPSPSGVPNNKKLPKPLQSIIAQLQSVFPNYSSSDLTAFIRDVQRRNGNSLAGLRPHEILSRATELILDQQLKAPPTAGRAPPAGIAPGSPQAAPAPKNSTKNPPQPNLQPWGNAGAAPKAKWKKQDNAACSEDPCAICHDELSRDCCELECGHRFHRECIQTWLKQHSSTCPICRVHALLPEDFPELPAWNKNGHQ